MLILVKHGISGGDCPSSLQDAGVGYHKCAKSCYFFLEITVFFCFLLAEKSVQYVFYDFGLSPSGPVRAIKDISLHINRGEIYGIIGLSGAGKSTLVRCINLLEWSTSGSILLIRITFIGESANEPVISRLIKNFDLNVGIFFGSLDDIKGVPFGRLIISLVGESAMAGAIGGGLGDLAIRYGYQRFRPDIMIATVVVLIVMVQFEFIIFYSNFPHRCSFHLWSQVIQ